MSRRSGPRGLRTTLSAEGYEVQGRAHREDALIAVREHRFELILLDINMPGIGASSSAPLIRSDSEVVIIMLRP